MTIDTTISVGDIVTAVAALAAVVSIALGAKSFREDHRRRKKEATIAHINEIRENYRTAFHKLTQDYHGVIDTEQAENIHADPQRKLEVEKLLSLFEHLAAAANADVLDLRFLNKLAGTFLIEAFEAFRGYIICARSHQQARLTRYGSDAKTTKYDEFSDLAQQLSKLRSLHVEPLPVVTAADPATT